MAMGVRRNNRKENSIRCLKVPGVIRRSHVVNMIISQPSHRCIPPNLLNITVDRNSKL